MFSNAIMKGYEEGLHLFVARLTTKSCHMNAQVYVTYDHKGLRYVNAMDYGSNMVLIEVGLPHLQLYIQAVSVTGKAEFLKTQN
jgi:hypothetical protein